MKKLSIILMFALACVWGAQAKQVSLTSAADGSTITLNTGDTLTGISGTKDIKVLVAKEARVYLRNAFINHLYGVHNKEHAGLSLLGNGMVYLIGENVVNGFSSAEPGVYVPRGCKLRIMGNGKLTASSGKDEYDFGHAAGIGAGADKGGNDYKNRSCGDIEIHNGTIIANGGYMAAGIGGGHKMSCGNITIYGGTITAKGGKYGAGIGAGAHNYCDEKEGWYAHCENIDIYGGNIKAIGGSRAAGIGGGVSSKVKNITIEEGRDCTLEKVIAIKGQEDAPCSVGKGKDWIDCSLSEAGTVTVGGVKYPQGISDDIFDYPEPEIPVETPTCEPPTDLECISHTATSAYIAWEPSSKDQKQWFIATKRHSQGESEWNGHYCTKQFDNLTGLQPNTYYDVRVLAVCEGIGVSDYTEVITFKTDKEEEAAPEMPDEDTKVCSFPRYFELAEVNQNTATFTWIPWYDSDSQWELRLSDGNVENVKYYTTNKTQYTFAGLQSNTTYAVRIRTICGPDDKSSETGDVFFKTLASAADCKAPNIILLMHKSPTSVVLYWEKGMFSQNQWRVYYKKTSAYVGNHMTVDTESCTIENLELNSEYEVYVAGLCDGEEGLASQKVTFTIDRIVVDEVAFTGFNCNAGVGDTWTKAQQDQVATATVPVDAEAPYHVSNTMGRLMKYDETSKTFKDVSENTVLEQGRYKFSLQVRIDGDNGKSYRLPKSTEGAILATVNGAEWTVGTPTVADTYSYVTIFSPEFELAEKPCYAPTDIQVTAVTENSITFAWTPSSETQDSWYFRFGEQKDDFFYHTGSTLNPYVTIRDNDLTPGVTYKFQVKTYCTATSQSEYSALFFYTYDPQQGIDEIRAAGKATKIIRDGKVLIIKGDKTFDVLGAEVK